MQSIVNKSFWPGIISLSLFILLIIASVFPTTAPEVSATENISPKTSNINSFLSISAPSQVSVDIFPDGEKTFAQSTSDIIAATNYNNGYALYVNTGNASSTLIRTGNDGEESISPICAEYCKKTPIEFPINSWGYSISENAITQTTVYISPGNQLSAEPLYQTERASTDKLNFSVAMMINSNLPAGSYSGTVTISAVANPLTVTTLQHISTMQEINTEICENTAVGYERQLTDTRDGKKYWVAKLADGNCWMTQNLALDIDQSYKTKLTPQNTNIPSGYVWPETSWNEITSSGISITKTGMQVTETAVPDAIGQTTMIALGMRSWNLGNYVLATPFLNVRCGDQDNSSNPAACASAGFVKITSDWTDDFQAKTGEWDGTETFITADAENKTYDAHYLIGNYYQWNTATAGSGGKVSGNWISNSICPKGWTLPRDVGEKSYAGLIAAYKLSENRGAILKSPLSFVQAGVVNVGAGYYGYGGTNGYMWTSYATSGGDQNAGYISITTTSVVRSDNLRWLGYSVRCVAH